MHSHLPALFAAVLSGDLLSADSRMLSVFFSLFFSLSLFCRVDIAKLKQPSCECNFASPLVIQHIVDFPDLPGRLFIDAARRASRIIRPLYAPRICTSVLECLRVSL